MLRIHRLQHVAFEDLGAMQSHFLRKGHKIGSTHFYLGHPLPAIDAFDWVLKSSNETSFVCRKAPWPPPPK